jgi:hypothetical protein
MKKNILTIIVFLLFIISSQAQDLNTRKFLCEKKWQMTTWTASPAYEMHRGKGKETDLYKNQQECKKDDYYYFDYVKKFTLFNGEKTCMPSEKTIVYDGTWMFEKGQKNYMTLQSTNSNITFHRTITILEENKLVWTEKKVEDGVTYTFTETFKVIE